MVPPNHPFLGWIPAGNHPAGAMEPWKPPSPGVRHEVEVRVGPLAASLDCSLAQIGR